MKKTLSTILIPSLALFSCGKFEVQNSILNPSAQSCHENNCSAHLTWDSPTALSDGSPLPSQVGYFIYWGTSSGTYTHKIDNGEASTAIVPNLTPGTYYFAVSAYLTASPQTESARPEEARVN